MKNKLHILLADDDEDDRFFFANALKQLDIPTALVTVHNGEALITHLLQSSTNIPDVLFLDINMPRKKGSECLIEIKSNASIKEFPIVIHSTCSEDSMADELYEKGAYYCMKKGNLSDLVISLEFILNLLVEKKFKRPSREDFIILHSEVYANS